MPTFTHFLPLNYTIGIRIASCQALAGGAWINVFYKYKMSRQTINLADLLPEW